MSSSKPRTDTVDISEPLRALMRQHKLTVSQMAERVGVSKSAMEKYLAGPSSPRASTIQAICLSFGVAADWLLFQYRQPLQQVLAGSAYGDFQSLLHELKQPGTLSSRFSEIEWGQPEWRQFATDVASERAEELTAKVARRLKEREDDLRSGRVALGFGPPVEVPFASGASQEVEHPSVASREQHSDRSSGNADR